MSNTKNAKKAKVVAISGKKTINTVQETRIAHPIYKKIVTRTSKLLVHDENNQAKVGDVVYIVPCRPYSKSKSHRIVGIKNQ